MSKPKVEIVDVEFVEVIEETEFAPLGQRFENFAAVVVDAFERGLHKGGYWLFVWPLYQALIYTTKGFIWLLGVLIKELVKSGFKIILWPVLIAVLLLFVANGFSFTKTFSLEGIEVFWRAFK